VNEYKPDDPVLSDVWMGIGAKAGSMVVVAGIDTLGGVLVSLDPSMRYAGVSGSINRLGIGAGVGGGAIILIATGIDHASDLHNLQALEKDFAVSLGAKWGHAAKIAKMNKIKPFIDKLLQVGAKTPEGLKKALKANPDKWIELHKNCSSLKDALGVGPGDPPKLFVLDVPFAGAGTELSFYWGLTTITVLDTGVLAE
jgi:hypothetical protein